MTGGETLHSEKIETMFKTFHVVQVLRRVERHYTQRKYKPCLKHFMSYRYYDRWRDITLRENRNPVYNIPCGTGTATGGEILHSEKIETLFKTFTVVQLLRRVERHYTQKK